MTRNLSSAAVLVLVATVAGQSARADEKCAIVAEISVELVAAGSLHACLRSPHPGVCTVATILNTCPAAKELSKTLTEKGCEFVLEKVKDHYRVKVTGNKDDVDAVVKEFEKAKGMTIKKK